MRKVFPRLLQFNPDLIFISAGFDAHKFDFINGHMVGLDEFDYQWMAHNIVAIANRCCEGRVISVMEGGYNTDHGVISPFAQSVAHHVKGLMDYTYLNASEE